MIPTRNANKTGLESDCSAVVILFQKVCMGVLWYIRHLHKQASKQGTFGRDRERNIHTDRQTDSLLYF